MSEMKDFKKDFVYRTLEVLKKCYSETEYEVTLLLNCLLALVSFPIEQKQNEISIESEKFQNDCVKKLKELKNEENYINNDEEHFFNNIRNSIAHINIKLFPDENKRRIENVLLWNEEWIIDGKRRNKPKITFRVNISVENLKFFAEYVAEEYIKRFFN